MKNLLKQEIGVFCRFYWLSRLVKRAKKVMFAKVGSNTLQKLYFWATFGILAIDVLWDAHMKIWLRRFLQYCKMGFQLIFGFKRGSSNFILDHFRAQKSNFIWLQPIFMFKTSLWRQKIKFQFWTFYNPLEQCAMMHLKN